MIVNSLPIFIIWNFTRSPTGPTSDRNDQEVLRDQPPIETIKKSYGTNLRSKDQKVLWDQPPIEKIKKSYGTNLQSKRLGSPTGPTSDQNDQEILRDQPLIKRIRKSYGTNLRSK
ncbi:hypothetical protein ACOSQ4_029497 [Xanthoceras sorbifolium]